METIRTPGERLAGLTDFPWKPQYRDWEGIRLANLDEGPGSAPVAMMIHGEPTWSYLYRGMILLMLAAGYRVATTHHRGGPPL